MKDMRIFKRNMLYLSDSGHTLTKQFHVLGVHPEIAANQTKDVWGGAADYVFPATADMTHIKQSANDATMLGKKIGIIGLDINWDEVIQEVNLDGADTTTLVALSTPLLRVERIEVRDDTIAAQNIELVNAGETAQYGIIVAGNNKSEMAIYSVPRGFTAYIPRRTYGTINATNKTPVDTTFFLKVAETGLGYAFWIEDEVGIPEGGAPFSQPFEPYLEYPEKTDIKVSAFVDSQPGKIHASFGVILVDQTPLG